MKPGDLVVTEITVTPARSLKYARLIRIEGNKAIIESLDGKQETVDIEALALLGGGDKE